MGVTARYPRKRGDLPFCSGASRASAPIVLHHETVLSRGAVTKTLSPLHGTTAGGGFSVVWSSAPIFREQAALTRRLNKTANIEDTARADGAAGVLYFDAAVFDMDGVITKTAAVH